MTSMTSFSIVSVVDFEQGNVCWEEMISAVDKENYSEVV